MQPCCIASSFLATRLVAYASWGMPARLRRLWQQIAHICSCGTCHSRSCFLTCIPSWCHLHTMQELC
jgi:hypothetical protein